MSDTRQGGLVMSALAVGCVLAGLATTQSGWAAQDAQSRLAPGCRRSSTTPEAYSFFGPVSKVKERLGNFDMNLDRRVFMFVVESGAQSEVVLYEGPQKEGDVVWKVMSWGGSFAVGSAVRKSQADLIMRVRGYNCIGEETKTLLRSSLNGLKETQTDKAPKDSRMAFFETIDKVNRAQQDDYIGMTVFLLC